MRPDYKEARSNAKTARSVAIDTLARLQEDLASLTKLLLYLRPVAIKSRWDALEERDETVREIVALLSDIETHASTGRKTIEKLSDAMIASTRSTEE